MCTPSESRAPAGSARAPDLGEIVRRHEASYGASHPVSLLQQRVLHALASCRTAALGGHLEQCDRCGHRRAVYHSCRNRHCPKCQLLAQEDWLEARRADLLPIPYFHVVFTLPHALNRLALAKPRVVYDLLFTAASETLKTFGRDPKHLGGELGITAILHTWSQTLGQHIHLHCLVTGGALAADGSQWIPSHPRYLFPVRALSPVFRAKFLAGLQRAFEKRLLLRDDIEARPLVATLREKPWVVYTKRPFAGPESVLQYLGRYTHRIAISNDRILDFRDGVVRFRWRDYQDDNRNKIMTLCAEEFLRRFLLHVLPSGFMRIRHFGLLANRHRKAKLERCRELLAAPPPPEKPAESVAALVERLTGKDLTLCPFCEQDPAHHRPTRPGSHADRAHPGQLMSTDETDRQLPPSEVPLAAPVTSCVQNLENAIATRRGDLLPRSPPLEGPSPLPSAQQTRPHDPTHDPPRI